MPTRDAPSDRLAEALAALRLLQAEGHHVYPSSELTRTHRERLHAHGFLSPVMKG